MKLPRDVDAASLIQALSKVGYRVVRQSGCHIRLQIEDPQHSVTIPNHRPLRIGTLAAILRMSRLIGASIGMRSEAALALRLVIPAKAAIHFLSTSATPTNISVAVASAASSSSLADRSSRTRDRR